MTIIDKDGKKYHIDTELKITAKWDSNLKALILTHEKKDGTVRNYIVRETANNNLVMT